MRAKIVRKWVKMKILKSHHTISPFFLVSLFSSKALKLPKKSGNHIKLC